MRTILVTLLLVFWATLTAAESWTIIRTANDVRFTSDGKTWNTAKPGMALPETVWVRTGPASRVILAQGETRIIYRPDTLARIADQSDTRTTKVHQRRGSIQYDVEPREQRSMSIVTPHLAAVVKGTVFDVNVEARGSNVEVERGSVGVSADGESVDIGGGQAASVSSNSSSISVGAIGSPETSIGSSASSSSSSTSSRSASGGSSSPSKDGDSDHGADDASGESPGNAGPGEADGSSASSDDGSDQGSNGSSGGTGGGTPEASDNTGGGDSDSGDSGSDEGPEGHDR